MFSLFSSPDTIRTLLICCLYCMFFSFCFALLLPLAEKSSYSYPKPPIINNLSFLKIVFTYCIVVHHSFLLAHLPNNGHICVEFFFIISGFMLSYTYHEQKTIGAFALNKFIQFVPYIFLANLGCVLLKNNFNVEKFLSGILFYSTTNLYQNYTYYQPAWFLTVLFWVTLFYFSLMKNLRADLCYFIIGVITFVFLSLRADTFPIPTANVYMPFLTNGLIRGFAYVGLGCLLAIIYKFRVKNSCKPNWFYTLLEVCLLFYLIFMFFVPKYFASLNIMLICFIALLELFLIKRGYFSSWLDHPLWFRLSKFALPIYMTHNIFMPYIFRLNFIQSYSIYSKILIVIIFSTVLGIITYYLFDFAKCLHLKLFKDKK